MLWERSIGKRSERSENSARALGIHDEWPHVIFGMRIRLEIRDIVSNPLLHGFAPPDLPARRIPRLAIHVAGSSVIEHAAIRRPGPSPIRIDAHTGWIFRPAPGQLGTGFRPRSGINT